MEAIRYLMSAEYRNLPKVVKEKKKSIPLILFVMAYLCFIPILFNYANLPILKGRKNFSCLLCIGALMETPYIMTSFLQRKGIRFRLQDIYILFQAPVSPKSLLIYGKNRNLPMHAAAQFYMLVIGCIVYKVPFLSCLGYVLASLTIGVIRDTSLAILLYGADKENRKVATVTKVLVGSIIAAIALSLLVTAIGHPLGAELIKAYFHDSRIYAIPVVGWEIALIQLCITGNTTSNILFTGVNLLFVFILFFGAKKMPCHGDYFEDAIQYTEAYEYAIQQRKMGGIYFVGQKNRRRRAKVDYKKPGPIAYFYKGLLEYKKMPAFIFSAITMVLLFAAITVSFSGFRGDSVFSFPFCIVLMLIFICVVFQGFGIRWKKEIASPYFKLIPGKVSGKLFYILQWEYIKALIDGGIFVLVLSFGTGGAYIHYAIPTAIIYACVRCSRMHLSMICNALISPILGKFGTTIIEYFSIVCFVLPVSGILLFYNMIGREIYGFIVAAVTSICVVGLLFILSCKTVQHTVFTEQGRRA